MFWNICSRLKLIKINTLLACLHMLTMWPSMLTYGKQSHKQQWSLFPIHFHLLEVASRSNLSISSSIFHGCSHCQSNRGTIDPIFISLLFDFGGFPSRTFLVFKTMQSTDNYKTFPEKSCSWFSHWASRVFTFHVHHSHFELGWQFFEDFCFSLSHLTSLCVPTSIPMPFKFWLQKDLMPLQMLSVIKKNVKCMYHKNKCLFLFRLFYMFEIIHRGTKRNRSS